MKKYILLLLILSFSKYTTFAHNYGEHELIGNHAMKLFFKQLQKDSASLSAYLPLHYNSQVQEYVFTDLSKFQLPIGYGTLNALSGDHSENPLQLEEQLSTLNSEMLKVVQLHNSYLNQYHSGAPNAKLAKADPHFTKLALYNLSHFYEYGKGIKAHLNCFRIENVEDLLNPSCATKAFKRLHSTNAINMYVTVHTAAIYLAQLAGIHAKNRNPDAKKWLYYAFLYNAFADHFLEDAFSGGHLLVKRTLSSSIVNNKSLHDFYCKYGTEVVNLKGEIWTAYGDDFYNQHHNEYITKENLMQIHYPTQTEEAKRMIQAVFLSLEEVKNAFLMSKNGVENLPNIDKKIPEKSREELSFFLSNYQALTLIPLPYNTRLKTIMPDTLARNQAIKAANQKPYLRNYVRSRIANSLVIGMTNSYLLKSDYLFTGTDIRLNAGLLSSSYKFNSRQKKAGVLDAFHGYTVSFSTGKILNKPENIFKENWIIKGGLRSNFDFWVTNKRFLGIYAYNEIGYESRNKVGALVFVPQVGLQLGSLLNMNYYNMPYLLRIPAQLLLPLKFRVGAIISSQNSPAYFSGAEIDIVF
ncbi:MAG: hypothetical protein ACKVTZ_19420 [Bacteroidia bacterium]